MTRGSGYKVTIPEISQSRLIPNCKTVAETYSKLIVTLKSLHPMLRNANQEKMLEDC